MRGEDKNFSPLLLPLHPSFSVSLQRSQRSLAELATQAIAQSTYKRNYTANLEASRAPVHKLNGSLSLDCRYSGIHVLRYYITTEQQTTSHIFAVTWVTFHHLIGWLKTGIGDFRDTQLFMVGFFSRDNWSVSGQWEVNTWIWNQVSLHKEGKRYINPRKNKPLNLTFEKIANSVVQ